MNLETAIVALIVAVIGAAAGFVGGFLSARWQARNDLAQWRRDRLLGFCVELVAAGRELSLTWKPNGHYPSELVRRLDDGVAGILLLARQDLDKLAFAYQSAVLDVVNDELGVSAGGPRERAPLEVAAETQGAFLWRAHNLLLDQLPKQGR